jgi:hypothetical protein
MLIDRNASDSLLRRLRRNAVEASKLPSTLSVVVGTKRIHVTAVKDANMSRSRFIYRVIIPVDLTLKMQLGLCFTIEICMQQQLR